MEILIAAHRKTDPVSDNNAAHKQALDRRSFGFSRKSRLITKADYHAVFSRSRRFTDQYWTVLAHRRSPASSPKVGLAVAKKRARRAVDRNRLKRIAREAFRQQQDKLYGFHVVIMNRDAAVTVNSSTLRRSLDALFSKIEQSQST